MISLKASNGGAGSILDKRWLVCIWGILLTVKCNTLYIFVDTLIDEDEFCVWN